MDRQFIDGVALDSDPVQRHLIPDQATKKEKTFLYECMLVHSVSSLLFSLFCSTRSDLYHSRQLASNLIATAMILHTKVLENWMANVNGKGLLMLPTSVAMKLRLSVSIQNLSWWSVSVPKSMRCMRLFMSKLLFQMRSFLPMFVRLRSFIGDCFVRLERTVSIADCISRNGNVVVWELALRHNNLQLKQTFPDRHLQTSQDPKICVVKTKKSGYVSGPSQPLKSFFDFHVRPLTPNHDERMAANPNDDTLLWFAKYFSNQELTGLRKYVCI